VDTGIGPGPVEAFGGIQGCLPDELEQQGVRADEIDIVVLTHLHTPKSTGPLDNHLSKIEYARGDTIPTTILRGVRYDYYGFCFAGYGTLHLS
jgi:hypothetical protein